VIVGLVVKPTIDCHPAPLKHVVTEDSRTTDSGWFRNVGVELNSLAIDML